MKNVVSYRRVSTDKQVREGEGLEIQLERIKGFCSRNNYDCLNHFADEGISGAKETIARTGLMELLAYCKANKSKISYVVVDKVDRLSRELSQQLFIEKELLVCGIEVLYAAQESLNGRGGDPFVKAMRNMMAVFAELERDMIKLRLADGRNKKASNGNKPTGRLPFGYAHSHDRKSTVVNEAEAAVVRVIFDMRIKGFSLEQIAIFLNKNITKKQREKFNPVNQQRKWTYRGVAVILANDFYLGLLTHNGKKIQGNHEVIIDTNIWNKANAINKIGG